MPASGGNARRALAGLLLGALAIAFAPLFVRVSEVGPVATAFHRLLLALPLLWAATAWQRGGEAAPADAPDSVPPAQARGRFDSDRALIVLAGLFFAGDLALWHWAIEFTSVANATLFANVAPVFVTLAARRVFGERITGGFVLGLGVALVGAVFVVGASFELGGRRALGDALGIGTAVFYAGYQLTVKRLRARRSTVEIMASSGTVCCLVLLPITLLSENEFLPLTATGWLVLLGLALISHIGGQGLIAWSLAHLRSSFSSVALLTQPVAAALLAWALLDEELGALQAAGGAVVLLGILLARRASTR